MDCKTELNQHTEERKMKTQAKPKYTQRVTKNKYDAVLAELERHQIEYESKIFHLNDVNKSLRKILADQQVTQGETLKSLMHKNDELSNELASTKKHHEILRQSLESTKEKFCAKELELDEVKQDLIAAIAYGGQLEKDLERNDSQRDELLAAQQALGRKASTATK